MLKHLSIRNIAIIDSVDLSFEQGLTVITGESGSGKSILLDAIALAFGARVSPKEVLRSGQARGQVELLFSLGHRLQDATFRQLLADWDILLAPDEEELLLSREFTIGGSRSRVNGTPVNREILEALRPWIIDLHGQHELTSLFRPERQLACLDGYGSATLVELRRAVYEAYSAWRQLRQKLDTLLKNQRERLQQRDFLAFQLEELEAAELTDSAEDEAAREELKLLSYSEKRLRVAERAALILSEGLGHVGDEGAEPALLDQLAILEKLLAEGASYDAALAPLLQQVEGAHAELKAVAGDLSHYAERVDMNPERIGDLTDRLDLLEKLKRKYGPTLAEVLLLRDRLAQELDALNTAEDDSQRLQRDVEERESLLADLCEQLRAMRQVLAADLKNAILSQLQDLAMPNVLFDVVFQPTAYGPDGADEVTFLFSANPGDPMRPLAKVASGGELSRFLLAMKVLTAGNDGLLTLIFDEIDSGVSGPTAKALAEKLARLSLHMQILAITHQPVIAAMGRQHFHVEKQLLTGTDEGHDGVVVSIQNLSAHGDTRLNVLSRLASGLTQPDQVVESFIRRLRDEAAQFYGQLSHN
jgi:DNA repair protein RecN (Recombination protein N)